MVTGHLVFDGDCGFCTRAAGWAQRIAPADVTVTASRMADLGALGLTDEQCREALQFVDAGGRAHSGSAAVAAFLRASAGPWSLGGRVLAMPGISSLARLVYQSVARHRHRLPGGTAHCRPSSDSPGIDSRG